MCWFYVVCVSVMCVHVVCVCVCAKRLIMTMGC